MERQAKGLVVSGRLNKQIVYELELNPTGNCEHDRQEIFCESLGKVRVR
jgi:FixJ family two-component response regulator